MTLVEMLLAAVLGLVVVGAALPMFIGGAESQPRAQSQAAGVQTAQTAMERMAREVRQGTSIVTASATQLSLITYVDQSTCSGAPAANAISCRVTYTCASGACTRVVAQPDGSAPGAAQRVVSGLASDNVFSYLPNYVGMQLVFDDSDGRNAITLSDGVGLRNS